MDDCRLMVHDEGIGLVGIEPFHEFLFVPTFYAENRQVRLVENSFVEPSVCARVAEITAPVSGAFYKEPNVFIASFDEFFEKRQAVLGEIAANTMYGGSDTGTVTDDGEVI